MRDAHHTHDIEHLYPCTDEEVNPRQDTPSYLTEYTYGILGDVR
jgi:hypothetical protein